MDDRKVVMKRITCFIDSLGAGGAQRQLVGLAAFLKEQGYDVSLAFYHNNCFYLDLLNNSGVPYVYLKKAQKSVFRIWHVARYFRNIKPDLVIAYLETPSICACAAKMFNHRFKLIVSERSTTQHTGYKERIKFNLFRKADYVVPNAYAQEEYIKRTFPFLSDKVVTIPNFVDLDHFVPVVNRQRRDTPEVMIAASIRPNKNTLGVIEAVAAMKAKGLTFHLSWYGLNESFKGYCDSCQEKIKQLCVADCVELKEKTDQIKECYQNADYFCLPSFYEGTPNVICEAMACGLPVVCSDVCDNSKYVVEGENGFLFNPKDKDSIVAAFEHLLTLGDKDYRRYCQNSRALAEQKLSKEAFVNAYKKLIG